MIKEGVAVSTAVLVRIKGVRPSLKTAELKVADYILKNPQQIETSTVAQVATLSSVSEATVIRFCRTIGYGGYQELRMQIARELYEPSRQLMADEIKDADDSNEIVGKVFSFNIKTLNETLEVLDVTELEKAAKLIGEANKVLIIGVGTSSANVQDAHNKFFRLGINSVAESDAHLQLMEASLLSNRDLVLAITHSGRTKDPVETVEIARKAGAKTIVITSDPKSPITEFADVILLTSSSESRFRREALASRLAQMSIIDVLHTMIGIRYKKRAVSATKKIEAVVGQKQIWEKR